MIDDNGKRICPMCDREMVHGQTAYSIAVGGYEHEDDVIEGVDETTVCSKSCVRALLPLLHPQRRRR